MKEDLLVRCKEEGCENEFIITGNEQSFFEGKGLALPKRCPECRAKRRKEQNSQFGGIKAAMMAAPTGKISLKNGVARIKK